MKNLIVLLTLGSTIAMAKPKCFDHESCTKLGDRLATKAANEGICSSDTKAVVQDLLAGQYSAVNLTALDNCIKAQRPNKSREKLERILKTLK